MPAFPERIGQSLDLLPVEVVEVTLSRWWQHQINPGSQELSRRQNSWHVWTRRNGNQTRLWWSWLWTRAWPEPRVRWSVFILSSRASSPLSIVVFKQNEHLSVCCPVDAEGKCSFTDKPENKFHVIPVSTSGYRVADVSVCDERTKSCRSQRHKSYKYLGKKRFIL